MIVGHSQGAALSYQTLQMLGDHPSEKTRLLVTVGSGLQKLQLLADRRLDVGVVGVSCIYAASYLCISLAEWLGIIRLPGGAVYWYLSAINVVLVISLFAESIWSAITGDEQTEIRKWAKQFSLRGGHWVDLFASSDPVPNGPLLSLAFLVKRSNRANGAGPAEVTTTFPELSIEGSFSRPSA